MMGKAFTVSSLADRWCVSTDTVYAMIHAGRLNAFRFGGKLYRIRPEEVERFECQSQDIPSNDTEESGPSSGARRTDATDIRLERLIDHRPMPRLVHSGPGDQPGAA
ncbi:helix-turn-helix domain-containing protein [Sphingomonas montanisoli]|uniref:Helix-turn-helix domain-containing protein n=2 Tax=Sphingomonas montanisoli TaxID=2606412 RepID=A0A5D9C1W4_9SPHN|nr:helix-turn-helix domain-containing protein [Sphingomonas montanisoli]